MHTRSAAERRPVSGWTVAAWVFFGLGLLEAITVGVWWLSQRPALTDPRYGSAAQLFLVVGTGIAWMIVLTLASLGTLCGLIGVARSAHPRRADWATLILNGAIVLVSLVLLLTLSPQ